MNERFSLRSKMAPVTILRINLIRKNLIRLSIDRFFDRRLIDFFITIYDVSSQTMGRDPKVSRKNLTVGLLEVQPRLISLFLILEALFDGSWYFPSLFSSNE